MTLASWFSSVKQSRRCATEMRLVVATCFSWNRWKSSPAITIDGITGVVALYQFNNPADLGQDTSGTGNNLVTDTGTPTYSSQGLYGGSLYLNGSSTMDLPGAAFPTGVPTGDSPYTVAAWVKAAPGTSLTGGWLGYGNNADSQGNNFRLGNGSVGGDNDVWEYWYNNDFGATLPGNETFYDGFHSVVATWDGTNEDIYLDGVLAATARTFRRRILERACSSSAIRPMTPTSPVGLTI